MAVNKMDDGPIRGQEVFRQLLIAYISSTRQCFRPGLADHSASS